MRRTVLYISMSLDGCLARPDGDVSWLAGQDPDDPDPGTYPAFLSTVDTVVMGWTTYHQVVTQLSPGSWPYRGLDCYVLTHRPLPPQTEKIQAFSGPAHQLVEQLKREPAGRDIWICGGAHLVKQCMEAKLIDRYHLTIIPVILGNGIPLFPSGTRPAQLELVSLQAENGATQCIYRNKADVD
mgnify:CR=1 FL=1